MTVKSFKKGNVPETRQVEIKKGDRILQITERAGQRGSLHPNDRLLASLACVAFGKKVPIYNPGRGLRELTGPEDTL